MERDDIAYVGRINSRFVILAQGRSEDGWEPTYKAVMNQNKEWTAISGGILTRDLTTGTPAAGSPGDGDWILYFDATRVDGGWKFEGFRRNEEEVGYMGYGNDHVLRVGPQARANPSAVFTMTPDDPSGYDDNYLWTGVRYRITSEDDPGLKIIYFRETVINNTSNTNLNGLLQYQSVPPYDVRPITDIRFTLIPIDMFEWLSNQPSVMGELDPVIRVAQCALYPNSGYGGGSYCDGWRSNRGFTTGDDVQSIIYYYSQDGSCGNSYTFNNYWNQSVEVESSFGSCTNDDCNYREGRFICGDGNGGDGNGDDDDDGDDEEDSLLNSRVLILLVLGVIILIVLIVIIIAVFYYMNGEDENQQETQSNSEVVLVV